MSAFALIAAQAQAVIPAEAGIQCSLSGVGLDSRLRGNDGILSRAATWLLAILLAATAGLARADVWGWVDDHGVAHFASEKVDDRYQLFWRGGESFDTSDGVPGRAGTPRPVAVPTSAARLIAYFEVSPGYKRVQHHLREASRAQRIDVELLQALIATESGFDAAAVSAKGAIGLMQLMPATAERYGVAGDLRMPLARKLADPAVNIRTGSRYLRDLLDLYTGDVELALAAYNAGEGAVQRAGNRIPNYRETQNYVRTVLQLYAMLKPPALKAPTRVRVELGGAPAPSLPDGRRPPPGGAIGRGNLPPGGVMPPTDAGETIARD